MGLPEPPTALSFIATAHVGIGIFRRFVFTTHRASPPTCGTCLQRRAGNHRIAGYKPYSPMFFSWMTPLSAKLAGQKERPHPVGAKYISLCLCTYFVTFKVRRITLVVFPSTHQWFRGTNTSLHFSFSIKFLQWLIGVKKNLTRVISCCAALILGNKNENVKHHIEGICAKAIILKAASVIWMRCWCLALLPLLLSLESIMIDRVCFWCQYFSSFFSP